LSPKRLREGARQGIWPCIGLQDNALSALAGAQYHLDKVKELVASRAVQTLWQKDKSLDEQARRGLQRELNQFHWHLRAFLWELVAARDTALQWVNQAYGLGIEEAKVTWPVVKSEAQKQCKWCEQLDKLEKGVESDQYFEIREYRNFAHRAFLLVYADYDENNNLSCLCLVPVREGQQQNFDLIAHLTNYLEAIRTLFDGLSRP